MPVMAMHFHLALFIAQSKIEALDSPMLGLRPSAQSAIRLLQRLKTIELRLRENSGYGTSKLTLIRTAVDDARNRH